MKMKLGQERAFAEELALAREAMREGRLEGAFRNLERAHVLGQRHVGAHVRVHALMLALELRRGRPGAACGQLVRIVLGALGSAVGRVPAGNTGGTDISMFRRMPIDPALGRLMDRDGD
jgi:hypothetical protein